MQTWLAIFEKFNVLDVIDILIVAFILYRLLVLIRGTRAVQLLQGVIVILLATGISSVLHLTALNWLLNKIMTFGLFAIPVVFQPELRRALESLGGGGFFSFHLRPPTRRICKMMTAEVVKCSLVSVEDQNRRLDCH